MDREAFHYCNRLLQNSPASTAIEISVGGLQLESLVDTYICLTGAPMPLSINGQEKSLWAVQRVYAGDIIQIGFARSGCRSYFGVADGFTIKARFGSTATVVRENIGGLRGHSLQVGDQLPCPTTTARKQYYLADRDQPRYQRYAHCPRHPRLPAAPFQSGRTTSIFR